MTKELLVTGGLLRENGFDLGEGMYYGTAVLASLNIDNGHVTPLIRLVEGNENYPSEHPNLQFTAGCIDGGDLWLPTDTEIRKYNLETLSLERIYSQPCFQNIHSVAVQDDHLFITTTGLDAVVIMDKDSGAIRKMLNAEGKPVWHRFSATTDYRKLHSTRPHDCHPNYVFFLDGKPWVTRCTQEDAVSLNDVSMRIDISGPDKEISVHDGIVVGDEVVFTSVDGCIVIADTKTRLVKETIDLTMLKGFGGTRGWCRGLHYEGGIFYIGFSRLRRTRSMNKLKWLKDMAVRKKDIDNCSVLAFNLLTREIVGEYNLPKDAIHAIYTILPYR